MTRKVIITIALATCAAIGSQAFSSNASAQRSEKESPTTPPKTTDSPAAPKATDPPAASTKLPELQSPSNKITFPTSPTATKATAPTSKDATKKSTTDASPVTASPLDSKIGRKELVIPRALVTLIYDNKVPASEPGMLLEVPVEEGQSVEKDQILAQIDSRSTEARRRIAEAEHAGAMASYENQAEIEVAEKAVEVTKAEYDQSVEIREKSPTAIPLTQLRKDKFNWEKSIAQVKQARNENAIAGLTANAKKAQHDAASIELELRQARAPFRGQVVEVLKKTGDWVTAGEPILHIVGLDKVRVKGFVLIGGAEGASHDEVLGRDVSITVFGAGEKKHTVKGKVGFASPVIEGVGTSRQFRIWADVENEKTVDPTTGQEVWKIQPGSMATMTIDMTQRTAASRFGSKVDAYKPVSTEVKSDSKKKGSVER